MDHSHHGTKTHQSPSWKAGCGESRPSGLGRGSMKPVTRKDDKAHRFYLHFECTVGQYMIREVKTVNRQTTLRELEALFAKHDFNAFPVMDGKEMIGLVTKFDFLKTF